MIIGRHRNTYATIDLSAIQHNINVERQHMNDGQALFAVVKADAYGHGLVPVAIAAQEAGVDGFCVALIDEAVALREVGITKPILILGITPVQQATYMAKYNLSTAVGDLQFLKEAQVQLEKSHLKLRVHLALDTGMGRIGFRNQKDLSEAIEFLEKYPNEFDYEGIFTHFSTADSSDDTYFEMQLNKFQNLMEVVKKRPKYVHVANSAASIWHKKCGGDLVRLGIGMYGLNPSGKEVDLPEDMQIKPAFSLSSELVAVKKVHAGDSISYGTTYTAEKDEWIGTVPMGYADGWLRRMQGSKVLVEGHECEIVGRICMDQFMIRLPYKMDIGKEVTLIGENNGKIKTAQDAADFAGTIHYEIVCSIAQRVPRFYKK
ncbi:alanine racemase [Ligilactobacillus cholophilus]|uniref:alanine racemase n=1 Tax=Ligilactobacillus cholophilus TaxID=3050131 RepID=UPI0025B0BC87|nr:alanine racemase [Ligilactobacillus cholophilus]